MKSLILSRLWMLISIIILTTGQAWAKKATTKKVFTSIKDLRDAAQTNSQKHQDVVIQFDATNPATVVAVMTKHDPNIKDDDKFINSFFIVNKGDDDSYYGLWVSPKDIKDGYKLPTDLAIGSKFTGAIIGDYNEGTSGIPYFGSIHKTMDIGGTNYSTTFDIDHSGEASADGTKKAVYPVTVVNDVNTIANNNVKDITKSSYGKYLNTIIQVPGTIKKGSTNGEYYLVQNETTSTTDSQNRIYFSCSQLPNINIDDYVGTSGTFEGILIKRNDSESKLIVLKGDFFKVNKIYLDENDAEGRVEYLVQQGALKDKVDVYVHRTNLVNKAGAWNTICLPFDLTKDEFQTAFGCTLTALAKPTTTSSETAQQWAGQVSDKGVLAFTKLPDTDLTIKAGVPYLMQASGTQTYCLTTIQGAENKTPEELKADDSNYYAPVGKKTITVKSPYEVKASWNDDIVNGEFYFRGLYGRKKYTDGTDGKLTTTLISDNGSQKYQYISTAAGNYLKYLPSGSTLQFNGMRAYFYFPNWNAENNNKAQAASKNNNTNAKIHVAVMAASTTGISNISAEEASKQAEVYNLSGQRVDASYKGIVVRNGRKYLRK